MFWAGKQTPLGSLLKNGFERLSNLSGKCIKDLYVCQFIPNNIDINQTRKLINDYGVRTFLRHSSLLNQALTTTQKFDTEIPRHFTKAVICNFVRDHDIACSEKQPIATEAQSREDKVLPMLLAATRTERFVLFFPYFFSWKQVS